MAKVPVVRVLGTSEKVVGEREFPEDENPTIVCNDSQKPQFKITTVELQANGKKVVVSLEDYQKALEQVSKNQSE